MLYRPVTLLPDDLSSVCDQLDREHNTIAQVFNSQDLVHFEEINTAPEKPRAGDTRYADGTNWDPGFGRGIYVYYSGAWQKLASNLGIANVKEAPFNAAGDGTTNDTTAFNLAIATGKPVYVPPGTYLLNALDQITSGYTIFGTGKDSILKFDTTGVCIDVNLPGLQSTNYTISGLTFTSVNHTPAASIKITQGVNTLIERCTWAAVAVDWCIDHLAFFGLTIRDCIINSTSVTGGGIRLQDNLAAPRYSYVTQIYSCDFSQCTNTAIKVERPVNLLVEACVIEGSVTGIELNTEAAGLGYGITLKNIWFEANTIDIAISNGIASYFAFIGCNFDSAGTKVTLGDSGQGVFLNCFSAGLVVSGSGSAAATLIECQNITQSGTFAWLSTVNGKQTLKATTTSAASLNLPIGSAPSSPDDGDIWREDNTNTGVKIRVNGVTKTITLS